MIDLELICLRLARFIAKDRYIGFCGDRVASVRVCSGKENRFIFATDAGNETEVTVQESGEDFFFRFENGSDTWRIPKVDILGKPN